MKASWQRQHQQQLANNSMSTCICQKELPPTGRGLCTISVTPHRQTSQLRTMMPSPCHNATSIMPELNSSRPSAARAPHCKPVQQLQPKPRLGSHSCRPAHRGAADPATGAAQPPGEHDTRAVITPPPAGFITCHVPPLLAPAPGAGPGGGSQHPLEAVITLHEGVHRDDLRGGGSGRGGGFTISRHGAG
jgi:hypothetical protein